MRWAMRIFGGLNMIASILSLYYFAWGIEIHLRKWPGDLTVKSGSYSSPSRL